jgi:TP53 regulating kinase and related kinases
MCSPGLGSIAGATFLSILFRIYLLQQYLELIAKGAESNIYLTKWYNRKAISKIRIPKIFREQKLDSTLRRQRTIHEALIISEVKGLGLRTPYLYFVDAKNSEIIMEYIKGTNASFNLNERICFEMGEYAASIHANDIIHGDLNPNNVISGKHITMIDFGLSFNSNRIEDKAVDVRLIKEIFNSLYSDSYLEFYSAFLDGYSLSKEFQKIINKIKNIEMRRRYAVFSFT